MQSLKQDQRLEAIRLRRHNLTSQDILCRLPVAKSTLWRWLKAEGLVETQPQRLTELRRLAQQSWKRHRPTIFRRNVGNTYHGLLRIVVPKSSDLNRRINGWIHGMCVAIGE